ncbi:MAG: DUF1003 domain-containing protein [Saprospiraceae bacterium]|jgi:uncharacterized membrane protein|nr:DUF1003 domain-containing protein [Saprospiraceae bacterium]MCA0333779.1 DUF1003 domain-containing protein [Bacteroidota bacterium]MCB0605456.1 DUF1003 domain-containing protein [Saprospiraceae bacterium]MCO5277163.1 DUF1003 domain-containing protein [Saprospiraceae bacterium]HMT77330.1 DUF1003 domain-containing protein [Saprospiraceae bacterium]
MASEAEQILTDEVVQLKKLRQIVKNSIEDENLIMENLAHPPSEILNMGQRISDKIARFGGSWTFIIFFLIILVTWIIINFALPKPDRFDPYPFILMNLVLSCIAALQAPIIMMSQNRQEEKDRKQNVNDYMVNLKSELQIRALHQKVDLLLEEQIKVLYESQAKQLDLLQSLIDKIEKKD